MNYDKLDHHLFIIDYNNRYERVLYKFSVSKRHFARNWTSICNRLGVPRFGLSHKEIQEYMQRERIPYIMHPGQFNDEEVSRIINTSDLTKRIMKVVEHTSIGNY